jgi:hypothetical protein
MGEKKLMYLRLNLNLTKLLMIRKHQEFLYKYDEATF